MRNVRTETATASFTALAGRLYLVDCTAGNVVATLPAAAWGGDTIMFKKTDASANTVILTRAGTDTIDGATTKAIANRYTCIEVAPDAGKWHIVGSWVT